MEDLISIIVPVYNAERTLSRCIESLIHQTYPNIEILLIDDGSSDGSNEICNSYAHCDSRIRLISKNNGGVSSARNIGIDTALGKYIMFCDSDDWVEPDWCRQLWANYKPNSLTMCGYYIEEAPNGFVGTEYNCVNKYARNEFYNLKMSGIFVPWNKIFSLDIIRENCICFNERISNGEDMLFNTEYLSHISGEIIQIPYRGNHYVWPRESSLSKAVPTNYFEQLNILHGRLNELFSLLNVKDSVQWRKIHTDFFNEYQKGLLSLMQNSNISLLKKLSIAAAVMRSEDYSQSVDNAVISSNKLFCMACKSKNSFIFWLFICFTNCVHRHKTTFRLLAP